MAKRSIIKKLSKEQKSLLIGDGTISSNCVFKLSHSEAQREYLEWKVGLLDVHGIKNNGVKEYISSCGYNTFKEGRGTYSIATSSELDCDKFVNIVRPYIEQVPSLLYKIRRDSTKLEFIAQQRAASEARDTLELE